MRKIKLFFIFICILANITSCKTEANIHKVEKLTAFSYLEVVQKKSNDTIFLKLKNKLSIDVYLYSQNAFIDSILNLNKKFISRKSELEVKFNKSHFKPFHYSAINPNASFVELPLINLPFQSSKKYKILQGYNGNFSHNKINNRFAIDFKMPIGDTICAVAEGVVIEIVKGYEYGGKNNKWKGFDNYIWIYHPQLNLISSYAHLKKHGSLVAIGDKVYANQPIGLSGNTGYSTEPHLHFHMLKLNSNYEYESVPYNFKEGFNGSKLKIGDSIYKNH